MEPVYFKDVTLLITHYNRSKSLKNLLETFINLSISFEDIVVSDDCSNSEHLLNLEELKNQYSFRLIKALRNSGLGNNINKGQNEVKTPFTLYVQEDFEPTPSFAHNFANSLLLMNEDSELDIIRFYAYFKYPYLMPYKQGFSSMIFSPLIWHTNHLKFYCYSDHPHLRRSNFFDKFGAYVEGKDGDTTEYSMCLEFIRKRGKGLFFDDFNSLFHQKNSTAEPSTMQRSIFKQKNNIILWLPRAVYLKYKLIASTFKILYGKN